MKNTPSAAPEPAPSPAPSPRLFGRARSIEGEKEIPVGPAARSRDAAVAALPIVPAVDLGDGPKALFVMGPGRSGKTTLLRYILEEARPGRPAPIAAALDPQNRSLATFVNDVAQPDTTDPTGVARWAEELLGFVMAEKQSALLDMGGGDLSMGKLLEDVPDLAGSLEEAGVHPVAIYTLSPRVDDLSVLAGYEAQGFQPKATALILNAGLADPTMPREDAFARVLRHSAFRAAVERGAVPIWMPRLDAGVAAEIEGKRLRFGQARDGQTPADQPGAILGPFDRSRVRKWMADMAASLVPIRSWIP
ncbi:DEAD/DEAH box helicase family protein [Roseomonas mucosa]|jgi:hypothetical protein|uniref:hypothetical protein n=1 Tax=Roseomonas mucosa TaxID=207340 RepID=UPI000DB2FF11|nr:hypothetical protein [Roseomonas mucosa]MDT8355952.1 hypothetical protein [Roseomonas mucosa]PZR09445.1 MAG: hypothetical protein DI532_20200 [Azospirillum brasilense]